MTLSSVLFPGVAAVGAFVLFPRQRKRKSQEQYAEIEQILGEWLILDVLAAASWARRFYRFGLCLCGMGLAGVGAEYPRSSFDVGFFDLKLYPAVCA